MVESGVFCLPLASVDFVATKSDICTDNQCVERIVNIFAAGRGSPVFYANCSTYINDKKSGQSVGLQADRLKFFQFLTSGILFSKNRPELRQE